MRISNYRGPFQESLKNIIQIYPNTHIISVLGVVLGESKDNVKHILLQQSFDFEEVKICHNRIEVKISNSDSEFCPTVYFYFGNIKKGDGEECLVVDMDIAQSSLSKPILQEYLNSMESLFQPYYFKKHETLVEYANFLQHWFSGWRVEEDGLYRYCLKIGCNISKCKVQDVVSVYYNFNKPKTMMIHENKKRIKRTIDVLKILKVVGAILLLVLAYLFVLNDRYYITQKSYFDKWTKTMYYLNIAEEKWEVVTKE